MGIEGGALFGGEITLRCECGYAPVEAVPKPPYLMGAVERRASLEAAVEALERVSSAESKSAPGRKSAMLNAVQLSDGAAIT